MNQQKMIKKRNKYRFVSLLFLLGILFKLSYCQHQNSTAGQKAPVEDIECMPELRHKGDTAFMHSKIFYLDSIGFYSYKPILTKDSTVIGIWFYCERDIYIDIYYSKNYKLYNLGYRIMNYYYEDTPTYRVFDTTEVEEFIDFDGKRYVFLTEWDYKKHKFDNYFNYISRKDSALIFVVENKEVASKSRKIDSIRQPLAERNEYVAFCQKVDTNTIGWFPAGAIMYRPFKKYGNYYIMFMSDVGWQTMQCTVTTMHNDDICFQRLPEMNNNYVSYYILSKDSSTLTEYRNGDDKLVCKIKRDYNFDYMDGLTPWYLFCKVYGYKGKFIPYK